MDCHCDAEPDGERYLEVHSDDVSEHERGGHVGHDHDAARKDEAHALADHAGAGRAQAARGRAHALARPARCPLQLRHAVNRRGRSASGPRGDGTERKRRGQGDPVRAQKIRSTIVWVTVLPRTTAVSAALTPPRYLRTSWIIRDVTRIGTWLVVLPRSLKLVCP